MWVRDFGVFLIAVLLTAGPVRAQQSGAPAGEESATAVDWLSPKPLAWTRPETFNWADSPILLNAHEYGSYNNNILSAPPGYLMYPGETRGDYLLTTTVGASTKLQAESQQFFSDASFTAINYRHNVAFDGHNYNVDVGVNWQATSRCLGQVIANSNQQQATEQQLFGPGIETTRTQSIVETGKCAIYQSFSAILNSGVVSSNSSTLGGQQAGGVNLGVSALDNVTAYVQGGIQYEWSALEYLQFLAKLSETHFTNQILASTAQAYNASSLTDDHNINYVFVYNRTFSEMLNASASAGLAVINNQSAGRLSSSSSTTPIYSLTVNWLPSQKWVVQVAAARTVSPPTSILAGTQVGDNESVSVIYNWTSKLSLSGTVSRSYSTGAQELSNALTRAIGGYGASTVVYETIAANYQATPFTRATLSFQHTNRTITGENISTGIVMLGIDYQPR